MSTTSRNTNFVINKLCKHPEQFNFFQAIRILAHRPVRFKSAVGLAFPTAAIKSITSKFEVIISFIGLIGSRSALPHHYTEILIKQLHNKDNSLRDFLNIFHHRIISMYYQAWKKYHFWMEPDYFGNILSSLIGNKFLPAICYAGLLRQPHSVIILEQILSDYFNLPIYIMQFQPQRINLNQQNYSRISSNNQSYNNLGMDTVLGNKIYDVQSKFRICLGPLIYTQFQQLLPIEDMLPCLCELVRFYVGENLNFDIKLILRVEDTPVCQLCQNHLLLGWNTWLGSCRYAQNADQLILQPSNLRQKKQNL